MSNDIIHIGLGKAGSTFLQREVFPRLKGVDFRTSHGGALGPDFQWVYKINGPYIPLECSRAERRLLLGEVFRSEQHKLKGSRIKINKQPILASSEGFVGVSYDPLLNADFTAEMIATAFPHAKIVLTVRRQDVWAASLYHQLVFSEDRFRRFIDFEQLFQIHGAAAITPVSALRWDQLVEIYYNKFGPENVCVLAFEEFCQQPQVYLDRLMSFLDLDQRVAVDFDLRVNERPAKSRYQRRRRVWNLATSIKSIDRLRHELHGVRNDIITNGGFEGREFFGVGQDKRAEIRRILAGSNQNLSELCNFDFGVYGYH